MAEKLEWQALIGIALMFAVACGLWLGYTRPQPLPAASDKLASVSLASFRDGQSPLRGVFPNREQVAEDIALIASQAKGIRTYTAEEGMEFVPALAEQHDLHLIQGAWLGKEEDLNRSEIKRLIAQAQHYPTTIDRLMVGNEVLLRGDLTPEQLIAHIKAVKSQVSQPVSYADVWAFWLKYPQVAEEVDFITIHVLPYWEDVPISVKVAQQHLVDVVNLVKQTFPGKPILVGETGWPSGGRTRAQAEPSPLAQALYIRSLPELAARHGFDYNVIEAFDQRWKAQHEGTVGGEWGIWSSARQLKFSLSGTVSPIAGADWRMPLALGVGLLLSVLLALGVKSLAQACWLSLCSQLTAVSWVAALAEVETSSHAPTSLNWALQKLVYLLGDARVMTQAQFDSLYRALVLDFPHWFAPLWSAGLALFYSVMLLAASTWLFNLLRGRNDSTSGRCAQLGFRCWIWALVGYGVCFAFANRYTDIPLAQVGFLLALVGGLWYSRHRSADLSPLQLWPVPGLLARWMPRLLLLSVLMLLLAEARACASFASFTQMFPTLLLQLRYVVGAVFGNVELMLCVFFMLLLVGWLRLSHRLVEIRLK